MSFFSGSKKKSGPRDGDTGRRGEELAAAYLKGRDYVLVERNFRLRTGEVDIIAYDGATLVFIEVKTRTSDRFGSPFEAVDFRKQQQIIKTALAYITANSLGDCAVRFDVVAVYLKGEGHRFELMKNAFEHCGP